MLRTISVSQLAHTINEEYDLFICFNSYESRATTVATSVTLKNFNRYLIFTNQSLREEAQNNLSILLSAIPEDKRDLVELPLETPVECADLMRNAIHRVHLDYSARIFVDITTFTHEALLILLAIFKETVPGATISCAYVNAKEYSHDCEDPNDKWLSRGIGEIRSVLGYSGIIRPSQQTLLMVIVGYEYERAVSIIDAIEPDYLSLGYGEAADTTTEKNKGANAHYAQLVKQMATYYDEIQDFTLPCNNPFAAAQAILKELKMIGQNKNIVIVPMNNKISTIGAALVSFACPEVQLCYARALVYNYNAYSTPGDKCYLFDLPADIKAIL